MDGESFACSRVPRRPWGKDHGGSCCGVRVLGRGGEVRSENKFTGLCSCEVKDASAAGDLSVPLKEDEADGWCEVGILEAFKVC